MSNVMFKLVGVNFRGQDVRNLVATLGAGTVLALEAEPDNSYDPNAIKIFYGDTHIGYVAREATTDVRDAVESDPSLVPVIATKIGAFSALVELRAPSA